MSVKENFGLSSLLTCTGAATQPSHANPTYLLEQLPCFGTRDAGRKEKNTLKIAQKSRGSKGEDEDVVFKRLDLQRLPEIASALGNSTEIPFQNTAMTLRGIERKGGRLG